MTTTTTSTTSTTTKPVSCGDILVGLILETIYIGDSKDATFLGTGYEMPQCFVNGGLGQHNGCNGALFGIFGNGEFLDHGKLNNKDGSGGPLYYGIPTCEDFKNIYPGWSSSTFSRYNKKVLSKIDAQKIVAKAPNNCFLRVTFETAIKSGQTLCGRTGPHSEAAWFRLTNIDGDILYNGCFSASLPVPDLYIFPLCIQMEFITRIGPPRKTETRSVSAVPKGRFNDKTFYGIFDVDNNYKNIGYIMWHQNRWEYWESFNKQGNTRVPGGNFYGYNNSPLSPNFPIEAGVWNTNTTLSPTNKIKKILGGYCGCLCPLPPEEPPCDCAGRIVSREYDITGKDNPYTAKLKEIRKEKCCPDELPPLEIKSQPPKC